MNKICASCKNTKSIDDFTKDISREDKLNIYCRECTKDVNIKRYASNKNAEYRRTKKNVLRKIYSEQQKKSERRGHNQPTYSKKELTEWAFSQPLFHKLYDNWKRLDFQTEYKPSIDRIDNNIGYTISNIQLMTWDDNNQKGHIEHRKGVLCFDENGIFLHEFDTIKDAAEYIGVVFQTISAYCLKIQKPRNGYIWKYKEKKCQ